MKKKMELLIHGISIWLKVGRSLSQTRPFSNTFSLKCACKLLSCYFCCHGDFSISRRTSCSLSKVQVRLFWAIYEAVISGREKKKLCVRGEELL